MKSISLLARAPSADRLSGVFFLLAGLVMIFGIIPAEVDMVEGGNIAPSTLPLAMSAVLSLGGGILLPQPAGRAHQALPPWHQMLRALAIILVLILAVLAMSRLGFLLVAPALALTLMWISGERRLRWFVLGTTMVPAAIWVFVVQILGRQLI